MVPVVLSPQGFHQLGGDLLSFGILRRGGFGPCRQARQARGPEHHYQGVQNERNRSKHENFASCAWQRNERAHRQRDTRPSVPWLAARSRSPDRSRTVKKGYSIRGYRLQQ